MASTGAPRAAPAARLAALSPAGRGIAWMVASGLAFTAMILMVRLLAPRFSAVDLAFWRALFGALILLPAVARARVRGFRTRRHGLHFARSSIHFVAIVTWFYVVQHINLTKGIALQFTIPLFTIALAALFLGEKVGARRWGAAAVGFAGVLIILRPDAVAVDRFALVALLSAGLYGASNAMAKALSRTDTADVVVFYMNLWHVPMAAAACAVLGFTVPAWGDLPWLAGLAAVATAAHYMLTQAFRATEASRVMPCDFLKLLWVTAGAYVLFGQTPAVWAWVGGAVIFAATYDVIRREARAARR